jgi:hypothetical protein
MLKLSAVNSEWFEPDISLSRPPVPKLQIGFLRGRGYTEFFCSAQLSLETCSIIAASHPYRSTYGGTCVGTQYNEH